MYVLLTKINKIFGMLGILNNTFERTLVQKFSRIKVYNALTPPLFIWKRNLDPQKKKDKKLGYQLRRNFSEQQPGTHF